MSITMDDALGTFRVSMPRDRNENSDDDFDQQRPLPNSQRRLAIPPDGRSNTASGNLARSFKQSFRPTTIVPSFSMASVASMASASSVVSDLSSLLLGDGDNEEDEVVKEWVKIKSQASSTRSGGNKKKQEQDDPELEEEVPMATMKELFSFGKGVRTRFFFILGMICSGLTGLIYPASAFALATMFSSVASSTENDSFLADVRLSAYIFMVIGAWSLIFTSLSSFLLETAANEMAYDLSTSWFAALLRQDMAYHDCMAVANATSTIATNTGKFRRGMGRKLGEGVTYSVAFVGSLGYAFWASWATSLVVLAILPVMALTSALYTKVFKDQQAFADRNYAESGGIVYTTFLSIRTVLSLNAVESMISKFKAATEKAFSESRDRGWRVGLANGSMMGAFQLSYMVVTVFGAWLLYREVRKSGCDPSDSVDGNSACGPTGADVFGAFLGISQAGDGIAQIFQAMELLIKARVAIYPAMVAINRKVGGEDMLAKNNKTNDSNDDAAVVVDVDGKDKKDTSKDVENGDAETEIILPKYEIDSSSSAGLKPKEIKGDIELKNVNFFYPARPNKLVLNDFNLKIKAGQTVALVGPSGGGKSTIVQMLERFYDCNEGSVTIDGINIKEFNVKHLREHIGLVQQEPTLFATTIGENIQYGKLGSTMDEVEAAAQSANAHKFISKFPDQYETDAGDRGSQLSGGQKQRIAIARTLMKNPSILLLDEATSALDSESELVVQRALDDLLEKSQRTTIIIAHRLSTIRNADMIVFVRDGHVQETGTHEELMAKPDGNYRKLVESSEFKKEEEANEFPKGEVAKKVEPVPKAPTALVNQRPLLELKGVTFKYPNRPDNVVFNGLDLTVYEGETVALVGPSGQGKSTIVSLLERFYDPLSGSVKMLGVDLRDLNVKYLRNMIGLVEQEPTLFSLSIENNIKYGLPDATHEQVVTAAKAANAHGFVSVMADGYNTNVGERGCQLSGGQKQRIAIARAVIKHPRIMLLDEATSALDGESQSVVQDALDRLANSSNQTTLVIAHRLSTIRLANRVAFIAGGKVQEIGTFDELMAIPNGRFKRLFELQNMSTAKYLQALKEKSDENEEKDKAKKLEEAEASNKKMTDVEEEELDTPFGRIWKMALNDSSFMMIGIIGAIVTGLVFPAWGVMYAFTIQLLYESVDPCDDSVGLIPDGFANCQDYWDSKADEMQDLSLALFYGWIAIIIVSILGNTTLFYGFGAASEGMSKRVRDDAFTSIVRQEVSFFDKRNAGVIATQLQNDAGLLQAFTSDPLRVLAMNLACMAVSLVLALIFMWPLALLFIGTLPFMAVGSIVESNLDVEADDEEEDEDVNSPGALALESMTHIRTVASLTLEEDRKARYAEALRKDNNDNMRRNVLAGMSYGLGQLLQNWGSALVFWFGGWLLVEFPDDYSLTDLLIAISGLLFAMNGVAMAAQDISNKDEAIAAARRIFKLIDKESTIDPLSDKGVKDLGEVEHQT